jgi:2-dehydropantoate 2-reductase
MAARADQNGADVTDGAGAWRPARIGIIGAGVMGTSLAAIAGRVVPVTMVCRNAAAAEAIRAEGAMATGRIDAASRPRVVRTCEEMADSGGVSILFVATKTCAIPEVASALRPVLHRLGDGDGPPLIVSYQNGIEPGRQLMEMLEYDGVLRMVLNFGGRQQSHACVEVTFNQSPHFIGCMNPAHAPACRGIAELLTQGGLRTVFDLEIERHVWIKGVINAAMNPVAALINSTIGQVLDSPAAPLVQRLLEEGLEVARADGVDLDGAEPGSFLRSAMELLERGRPHTPSMVMDIRSGRESEVGQLNRQIVRHARALGMSAPTHEVVLGLIEAFDWKLYHREPVAL